MVLTQKINPAILRFTGQRFYDEAVGAYLIELADKIILFDLPTYST